LFGFLTGHAQLNIEINNAFQLTPLTDTLYLAGDFNNWAENDPNYMFQRTGFNTFQISISPPAGNISYKVTRGNWNKPEADGNGNYLNNRSYNYSGGNDTVAITIEGWEDLGGVYSTTASSNTHIWYDNMFIPQLNRFRRIWVYLPPDYHTSNKSYTSLYMQDGQSLFDLKFASFGEWEVDESLNDQFYNNNDPGCIIIGIDHGNVDRINEYSPWVNQSYGGGQGGLYLDFIVNTLVPKVDAEFRTIQDKNNRGIMGSSMGGLISQYGGTAYQSIFGKVGVLSPSFWFSSEVFAQVDTTVIQNHMKYWLMGGVNESSTLVQELQLMESKLISNGLPSNRVKLTIHADGQHSEWYWAREFPYAYYWLFYDEHFSQPVTVLKVNEMKRDDFSVYPNPTWNVLNFKEAFEGEYQILNIHGQMVAKGKMTGKSIDTSILASGTYQLNLKSSDEILNISFIKQ
jgi:predicted alpha/beta superfamily hydrolase